MGFETSQLDILSVDFSDVAIMVLGRIVADLNPDLGLVK